MDKKIFYLTIILVLSLGFANALTIEEINLESSPENITPIFFYGSGCPHCAVASAHLEDIENLNKNVNVKRLEINADRDLILELYTIYNVPTSEQGSVPIMFLGDSYYWGDKTIIQNIEPKIDECKATGCKLIEPEQDEKEDEEIDLFSVLLLAFVDAVNPCELAVLIILMTAILTQYPKQKNKALKAGLLFSLAIFLMYFIFGLILVLGFSTLTGITGVGGNFFIGILAVLAIVMGLLNLKDAIWYGSGGFIMEVPQKWRPKMKAVINGTTSPKGAFVVGIIVSFFLTPCTAGPYFVFGGILSTVSIFTAIPYMFLYMCIFISPMIIISLITYFGFAKVEDMGGWRERNLKKMHLVAGLLMLGIGIWMILTSFGIL